MKNPLEELYVFIVQTPKDDAGNRVLHGFISICYGSTNTAYAFYNYCEKPDGIARGYGYDKAGTALANLLEKLTGIEIINGASGINSVVQDANKKGIYLKALRDCTPKY